MYKNVLSKLTSRQDLSPGEVSDIISAIARNEITDVQISCFQVALLMKSPTLSETASIARSMRDNCIQLKPKVSEPLLDTCGTGGGLSTFNISTATAIVAAAAGIPVAKHGSRSISSLSGSADVLEALGVNINLTPSQAEELIENIGIAFLYAPLFHPVMCRVLPPEAELGIKTIFYTIIGPLINPAFATRHIMGVYKPELLDIVTAVADELGYTDALFVHGLDGLDEISPIGITRINELRNGEIKTYEITPEEFGLKRCTLEDVKTGSPNANARCILDVFAKKDTGPCRNAILMNAAGALFVGNRVSNYGDGIKMAAELIDSGAAEGKLKELQKASNAFLS